MTLEKLFSRALFALVLPMSTQAFSAPCEMMVQGVDPFVQGKESANISGATRYMSQADQTTSSASNHNSGVYRWQSAGTWVLEYSFYDPYAESRTANPEDYVEISYGTNGGSATQSTRTGGPTISIPICGTTTLPTTTVASSLIRAIWK